jgi:hypothetical protein
MSWCVIHTIVILGFVHELVCDTYYCDSMCMESTIQNKIY